MGEPEKQQQQRPDFNGSNYDDTFVGDLVNFVASNSFQSMFEQYFLSHALYFTDDEEHKLEYMEYYQEFHGLFEKQLEVFCTEKGIEQKDFLAKCNEATTDDVSSLPSSMCSPPNSTPTSSLQLTSYSLLFRTTHQTTGYLAQSQTLHSNFVVKRGI